MRIADQRNYFDKLKQFERKFTSMELKEYKMFFKRYKDDEDLDNLSFNKLKDLYVKYYENREKPDLSNLFKKNNF